MRQVTSIFFVTFINRNFQALWICVRQVTFWFYMDMCDCEASYKHFGLFLVKLNDISGLYGYV